MTPRFPRTVIIPFNDVVKSALVRLDYPPELFDTHAFVLHGDVSPGRESFTLTILEATPKQDQRP